MITLSSACDLFLIKHLAKKDILDTQYITRHLQTFGAIEIEIQKKISRCSMVQRQRRRQDFSFQIPFDKDEWLVCEVPDVNRIGVSCYFIAHICAARICGT